jgi:hypothetical protein
MTSNHCGSWLALTLCTLLSRRPGIFLLRLTLSAIYPATWPTTTPEHVLVVTEEATTCAIDYRSAAERTRGGLAQARRSMIQ